MMSQLELTRPFRPEQIKWRLGATKSDKTAGIGLAYIDARDVMQRLDGVLGCARWQCTYPIHGICELSIKMDDEWITKSNAADVTQVEAVKGQASDAFKRAAVLWGIGRYLYYLDNVWSPIVAAGKSHKLAKRPTLPDWALPGNWEEIFPQMFGKDNYAAGPEAEDDSRSTRDPAEDLKARAGAAEAAFRDKLGDRLTTQIDEWLSGAMKAGNWESVIDYVMNTSKRQGKNQHDQRRKMH